MVKHNELNFECQFTKDHSNQKNYRDSIAIWTCVPAMAKMQKIPTLENVTNPSELIVLALNKAFNIALINSDFDRNKSALEVPVLAVADESEELKSYTDKIQHALNTAKVFPTKDQLKAKIQSLKVSKETKAQLNAHFIKIEVVPVIEEIVF